MNLIGALALCVAALTTPSPAPTPSGAYNDASMHFVAPAVYQRAPFQAPVVDQDTEKLVVVAGYTRDRGQQNQRTIVVAMRAFSGRSTADWESALENDLRAQIDGLFISRKTFVRLSNGMPAYFIKLAYGEGFSSMQQYGYAVFDGRRGIWISESGRLGEISEDESKEALKDLAVVVYPRYR